MNRMFQNSCLTAVSGLLILTMGATAAMGAVSSEREDAALRTGFVNPSSEYRPRTWWHWLFENITKDGITKDLEAMKRIGLKGAHMANVGQGGPAELFGEDVLGSPLWLEKVEHAVKECERLGLTFGMASCSGWVAGGPWMTPELSMQDIVWRHTFVKGPVEGTIQLPQPQKNLDFYRDVAVLAFPTLPGDAAPLVSLQPKVTSSLSGIDWAAAIDGDPDTFVDLPEWGKGEESRKIIFEFQTPLTLRSLSMQMWEDSKHRMVKMFASDDGETWVHLVMAHRWRNHFIPCREEMIEGFSERSARFVKLELMPANLSVPMKVYEINFQSARLNQLHTKAARQRTRPQVSNPSSQVVPASQCIQIDQVLDLTDHLKANGELTCSLPAGDWTLLRFGHTSNGNEINPASERAGGLESDKMSIEALKIHLDNGMVRPTFERLGDLTGKVMVGMNVDSWEANCQTWTKKFPEEFSKRRGYDMRKWLIALTGRFVESVDQTERFLWDYRRTIGDLIAENFYGEFQKYCNEWGVAFESEAPGIGIPIQVDQIQCLGMLDIPQGEFWLGGTPTAEFPHWPGGQDNTKEAATAGHVYGKEIISCEAFTAFGHHDGHTQYPDILKAVGDRQFCKGMNEIVFHRYVHQPDDRVPGISLGQFGLNFERSLTWWEQGRDWIDYLSRCQFMLRQGRFFADVCYYYGEDVPGSAYYYSVNSLDPRQQMKPVLPLGYDYDVCDRTSFETMTVEAGHVVLPSGIRYAYLVLPDHARLTPGALQKVDELVRDGATVIGPRPSRSPSMNDFPRADVEINELAGKLWPETAGPGERRVGKGRVITGKTFETILEEDGLPVDFKAELMSEEGDVRYIHRKMESGDMYFVASQQAQVEELVMHFRVTGKIPEVWDPVTTKMSVIPMYQDDGKTTTIALRMEDHASKFILFREPAAGNDSVVGLSKDGTLIRTVSGPSEAVPVLSPEVLTTTDRVSALVAWEPGRYDVFFQQGGTTEIKVEKVPAPEIVPTRWSVSFQKNRGAPENPVLFESLDSWTERPEEGIKYFSGTARYGQGVNVSGARLAEGHRVYLDLGQVNHVAEVFVNEKPMGVLWKSPFRVDITDAVQPGANGIVIEVTNTWKNRLVGDVNLPKEERTTWASYPWFREAVPLMESGLLGPVRLLSSTEVPLSDEAR